MTDIFKWQGFILDALQLQVNAPFDHGKPDLKEEIHRQN